MIDVVNNPNLALLPVGWDWAYLLILAGVCTAYAMKLSYDALKEVSSFILNLSTNLEPVYSILLAFLLFEEHKQLNTGFFVGSALIMASVLFLSALVCSVVGLIMVSFLVEFAAWR
mgnify:CR=1 FL=1